MGRRVCYPFNNISVLGSTDKEVLLAIDPCTEGPLGALVVSSSKLEPTPTP